MKGYVNVFNIIARAVQFLDQKDINNYFIKAKEWIDNIECEIADFIPQLFNSNKEVKDLEIGVIKRTNFIFVLDECVKKYIDNNDIYKLMRLLQIVEQAMSNIIDNMFSNEDRFVEFTSLNSNIEETGVIILPFFNCVWQRNGRSKQHGYKFNHCLQKLYCIMINNLNGFHLKNIVVDESFFYQAKQNGYLCIGSSAITNKDVVQYSIFTNKDGEKYFNIDRINHKELIKENVIKIINKAKNQNIDILIFPELLGYEELNDEIETMISLEIIESYPPLIIMPSVWGNFSNTSHIILDNGKGIVKQSKQNPMIFKGEIKENIIPDNILYVIHCPSIGRICILICADILNFDYLEMVLKEIKASLILVPSFTTGSYDFKNALARCQGYDCAVVWLNTCAALHLDKQKIENFNILGKTLKSGRNSNAKDDFQCNKICSQCDEICLKESFININSLQFGKVGDNNEKRDYV